MSRRTPVSVLVGFHGSDQNALLKAILFGGHGMRIAVVVNAFAAVDIKDDQVEILDGLPLAPMGNGCVCYTPDVGLGEAVRRLASMRFDHVIIKTGDIVNPVPVVHQVFAAGPRRIFNGIVTTVNAVTYHEDLREKHGLWAGQIRAADTLFVLKTDRAEPECLSHLYSLINELNPLATVQKMVDGEEFDLSKIFEQEPVTKLVVHRLLEVLQTDDPSEAQKSQQPTSHPYPEVTAQSALAILSVEGDLDPTRINYFLGELLLTAGHQIDRIHGLLCLEGQKGTLAVSGVREQLEAHPRKAWEDGERRSRLVIIGEKGAIDHDALAAGLNACRFGAPPAEVAVWVPPLLAVGPAQDVIYPREHIPGAIADRYGPCPSCTLRIPLDTSVLHLDQLLRHYAHALRSAELLAIRMGYNLDNQFADAAEECAAVTTVLHAFVAAVRLERAVLVSLYLAGDKYGLTNSNQLRVGVMAHDTTPDSFWTRAQEWCAALIARFARFEASHVALTEAAGAALEGTHGADFMRNGLQEMTRVRPLIEEQLRAYAVQVGKWLTKKRAAARNVLGLPTS